MEKDSREIVKIRPLKAGDFEALVELDKKLVTGENRHDYWEKKFAVFRMRHPNLSLVATKDDRVVGCVMGNISGWEFGVKAGIGWVEMIGVDPEYQRSGIAKNLIMELLRQFKSLNVKKIYTILDGRNAGNRQFFYSVGFQEGQMVHLKIELE